MEDKPLIVLKQHQDKNSEGKPAPCPGKCGAVIRQVLQAMLDVEVVEESYSEWRSPLTWVLSQMGHYAAV